MNFVSNDTAQLWSLLASKLDPYRVEEVPINEISWWVSLISIPVIIVVGGLESLSSLLLGSFEQQSDEDLPARKGMLARTCECLPWKPNPIELGRKLVDLLWQKDCDPSCDCCIEPVGLAKEA